MVLHRWWHVCGLRSAADAAVQADRHAQYCILASFKVVGSVNSEIKWCDGEIQCYRFSKLPVLDHDVCCMGEFAYLLRLGVVPRTDTCQLARIPCKMPASRRALCPTIKSPPLFVMTRPGNIGHVIKDRGSNGRFGKCPFQAMHLRATWNSGVSWPGVWAWLRAKLRHEGGGGGGGGGGSGWWHREETGTLCRWWSQVKQHPQLLVLNLGWFYYHYLIYLADAKFVQAFFSLDNRRLIPGKTLARSVLKIKFKRYRLLPALTHFYLLYTIAKAEMRQPKNNNNEHVVKVSAQ